MGLLRALNDVGRGGVTYNRKKDGKWRHNGGKVEKMRGNTTDINKLFTYAYVS